MYNLIFKISDKWEIDFWSILYLKKEKIFITKVAFADNIKKHKTLSEAVVYMKENIELNHDLYHLETEKEKAIIYTDDFDYGFLKMHHDEIKRVGFNSLWLAFESFLYQHLIKW